MEIKSYNKGDETSILNLFKRVFKFDLGLKFWEWRFQENPSNEPLIELMWDDLTLAGHYGACPIEILIDNKTQKASLSLTTMTNPEYGGQGIFPNLAHSLYNKLKENQHSLIYGFPNQNSHYGFIKKLAWKNITLIPNFKLDTLSFTPKLTGKINSLGDKLNFSLKHYKTFLETTERYQVKINRTPEYLVWRYIKNPSNEYHLFEYEYNDRTYFAITKKYLDSSNNCQADIVELVFPNDNDILLELFSSIILYYKKDNISAINTWLPLNDEKFTTLEKIGFKNSLPITYLGYKNFNEELFSIDEKKWYFSMGDSDIY